MSLRETRNLCITRTVHKTTGAYQSELIHKIMAQSIPMDLIAMPPLQDSWSPQSPSWSPTSPTPIDSGGHYVNEPVDHPGPDGPMTRCPVQVPRSPPNTPRGSVIDVKEIKTPPPRVAIAPSVAPPAPRKAKPPCMILATIAARNAPPKLNGVPESIINTGGRCDECGVCKAAFVYEGPSPMFPTVRVEWLYCMSCAYAKGKCVRVLKQ